MNRLVHGEGPTDAKIMIVGESPNEQDFLAQRPFVGKVGARLTQCLQSASIAPYQCYMTNVVKIPPINNNRNWLIEIDQGRKKLKKVTPEYRAFEEKLYEEINMIKPNVIIALGNVPLYALTRKFGIGSWRGSVLEGVPEINNIKVVPTYDPYSALKQHNLTWLIALDIKKAAKESRCPELIRRKREFKLNPTFEEACVYLQSLRYQSAISFDIEIMNEELYCIAFARDPSQSICIPFVKDNQSPYFTVPEECTIMSLISDVLFDYNVVKIGQNISFDVTFLLRKYDIVSRNLHDTMVAQAILWPEFPKGLDFITSIYTDQPYYKDEGKKWFKIGGTQESFFIYNCLDALVCLEAFPKIEHELEIQGNLDAYISQIKLIEPLAAMQYRGIRINNDELKNLSESAALRMEELTIEIKQIMGKGINLNSTQQLQNYFYKEKGLKPYVSRATGRPTMDSDALKRLSRRGYKEASLLLEYKQLAKLKSTYYDMNLDLDGRLRCSYNPVGTKSGRLSSSKTIFDTGMNLQNQPPIMKKVMLADERYAIHNVDLAKAENHIVAYLGPDENMIMAFEKRLDLHRMTAALIFGKAMEDISDEPGSCSLASGKYSERFWGKKANHGLNYGLSYKAFGMAYEINESEAKFIVERYHAAYPGVRKYHKWIQKQLQHNRTITDMFGKKRPFFDRMDDDMYKEAYSFIPQSTVARIINDYGILFLHSHPDVELLNQVHDSIVFQTKISLGPEATARILMDLKKSLAIELKWMSFYFNLESDFSIGLNAYDQKHLNTSSSESLCESLENFFSEIPT